MAGSGISIRLRRRLKALLGIETLQQRVATLEAALLDARAAAEAQTAANAKALALANQRLVTLGEQVAAARAIADRATARLAEADGQLAAIDRQLGDGRAAAIAQAATLDLLRHEVQAVNDAAQGALSLAPHVDRQITRLDHDVLPAVTQRIDGVEALAGAAEQGAANAARHAAHVDGQVTRIDGALSAMAGRLAGVEGATARLGGEVESRLTAVESATAGLGGEIVRVEARLEIEAGRAQGAVDAAAAAQQVAASAVTRVEHVDAQVTRLDGALARQHGEIDALGKQLIAHRAETAARLAGDERIADDLTRAVTDLAIGVKAQVQKIDDLAGLAAGAKNLADNAMARAEHVDAQVTRIDGVNAQQVLELRQTRLGLFASEGGSADSGEVHAAAFLPFGAPELLHPTAPVKPDLVFVCSHGRTATQWLTRLLNQHPDILAAHGPMSPPALVGRTRRLATGPDNDPILNPEVLQNRPLAQLMDELRSFGPARFPVRVHTLSAFHVVEKILAEQPGLNVRVVNLVRHPATRIESYRKHWLTPLRRARYEIVLKEHWNSDPLVRHYAQIVSRSHAKVNLENSENAFFIMALRWIANDFVDFTLPIDHFASEAIVADPKALTIFMQRTFGSDIALSAEFMAAYAVLPRENTTQRRVVDAPGVYRGWADWQRSLFRQFCHEADLPRLYRRFGYDFSFAQV